MKWNIQHHKVPYETGATAWRHAPVTTCVADRQIGDHVTVSQTLKYPRRSPGHVITAVRPFAARGHLVDVVGGS